MIDQHQELSQDTRRLPQLSNRERRRASAAVSAPEPGSYLAIASGDEVVLIALEAEVTRLGRSLTADVRLEDMTVSRRHALVVRRDESWMLLDDRSMNGTYLNGQRVQEAPLRDGDVIELGDVRIRFVDVSA